MADLAAVRVTSVAQLESVLRKASARREPVLAYVTAEWCPSCRAMDRTVFADPVVKKRLGELTLVVVDVTRDGDGERAMLARLKAEGPPTLIALNGPSRTAANARIVGMSSKNALLDLLNSAGM